MSSSTPQYISSLSDQARKLLDFASKQHLINVDLMNQLQSQNLQIQQLIQHVSVLNQLILNLNQQI
jgi:hypothetical protein